MAKAKQPVIEMDFVSTFSELSEGTERERGTDAATAKASEAARKHDEYVQVYRVGVPRPVTFG